MKGFKEFAAIHRIANVEIHSMKFIAIINFEIKIKLRYLSQSQTSVTRRLNNPKHIEPEYSFIDENYQTIYVISFFEGRKYSLKNIIRF